MLAKATAAVGSDHPHIDIWKTGLKFATQFDARVVRQFWRCVNAYDINTYEDDSPDITFYLDIAGSEVAVSAPGDTATAGVRNLIHGTMPRMRRDFFGYRFCSPKGWNVDIAMSDLAPAIASELLESYRYALHLVWKYNELYRGKPYTGRFFTRKERPYDETYLDDYLEAVMKLLLNGTTVIPYEDNLKLVKASGRRWW